MANKLRTRLLVMIVTAISMGLVLAACAGGTHGTTNTSVVVRGILVDSVGEPIANVPVVAGGSEGLTNEAGSFELNVPEGTDSFNFTIDNTQLTSPTPPVKAPVQFAFSLNSTETVVNLISELPLSPPTPTATPGPPASTPTAIPSPTSNPSPTPATITESLSLSTNSNAFRMNDIAIFNIGAASGPTSSLNGKSVVLVVGTLGTGQTSITFSNNQVIQFPTAPEDLYYVLSLSNFVQIMQDGNVAFNLPVGVVSAPTTLFARALSVDASDNSLLAQSSQITIELMP